jgi:hypothetical protein
MLNVPIERLSLRTDSFNLLGFVLQIVMVYRAVRNVYFCVTEVNFVLQKFKGPSSRLPVSSHGVSSSDTQGRRWWRGGGPPLRAAESRTSQNGGVEGMFSLEGIPTLM